MSRILLTAFFVVSSPPAADAPAAPCATSLPADIAAPREASLSFALAAEGVQIYACEKIGAGHGWSFREPEAFLTELDGSPEGFHFAGPTWTAGDGSAVKAVKVGSASPDPDSIPWLLLRVVEHRGTGRMERIGWVQRVRTTGGLAPTSACDAAHAGAAVRVPYTATYCFLASAGRKDG